ncbi:MAG: hypothetical protein V3V16_09050 [Melioribacteraceae bacterium]
MKIISLFIKILAVFTLVYGCIEKNSAPKHLTPVLKSEWKRVIYYPENHLNDFCVFQDREDSMWHAIGIMGTGISWSEVSLFHSTSKDLLTPFENHAPLFTDIPADTNLSKRKHAPHIIWDEGYYHLFYRRPGGTIVKTKSKSLNKWDSLGEDIFEENDARDICILKIDDVFYMYYCQYINYEGVNRSSILLRKSTDLEKWGDAIITYVDLESVDTHSMIESPFVVKRDEGYYMFITHTRLPNETTVVLFSENPEEFPSGIKTWFQEIKDSHASEIIEHNNKYYIMCVSGPVHSGISDKRYAGWLNIAEMEFIKQK